jgi:hypothetical protein
MATVKFIVEVDIPEEDLGEVQRDPWRYFWSEVEDCMWESKVTLND